LGILKVEGKENPQIFGGKIEEKPYNPTPLIAAGTAVEKEIESKPDLLSLAQKLERGKTVYTQNCFACHQATGEGIPNAFPPLAKSDYLNADVHRSIGAVKYGLSGEITVNGTKYNSVMPKVAISDEDIASVLTYIYNNWGNNKTEVTPEMVKKVK